MDVETFATLGLGDSSYLAASGDEAVLVDPQRDAWRFVAAAEARGWRIRHVLETHVHNDYVSGALETRSVTGADVVVHAGAGPYDFPHRPIEPGDEIVVGDVRFVARAAPGHTFEHLAWEARIGGADSPEAVFTGGSLLVGSAGRSDLLGGHLAERLARLQFRTVRELAALPPATQVLPTHGAGSFCVTTAPSADRISTIAAELASNAALLAEDEETFVRQQLGSLGRYPAYYANMARANRAGPPLLHRLPDVASLTAGEVERLVAEGAWVVDGRDRDEFAAGHLAGALNIELNEAFGTYVGWIVPYQAPLVLVLPDPLTESGPEAMSQLIRIGWDTVAGVLAGGTAAWASAGRSLASYPAVAMRQLFEEKVGRGKPIRVLDVRQPQEWRDEGSIDDSLRIFVADIPGRLPELPRDEEIWVVCTTGHRAAIAASILDRAAIPVRLVARGGTVGWIERFASPSGEPVGGRPGG